jgi:hypothetical protein
VLALVYKPENAVFAEKNRVSGESGAKVSEKRGTAGEKGSRFGAGGGTE